MRRGEGHNLTTDRKKHGCLKINTLKKANVSPKGWKKRNKNVASTHGDIHLC